MFRSVIYRLCHEARDVEIVSDAAKMCISNKKIRIQKPDDQDMRIFLYSVALGFYCLLSNTALRFSMYLRFSDIFLSQKSLPNYF